MKFCLSMKEAATFLIGIYYIKVFVTKKALKCLTMWKGCKKSLLLSKIFRTYLISVGLHVVVVVGVTLFVVPKELETIGIESLLWIFCSTFAIASRSSSDAGSGVFKSPNSTDGPPDETKWWPECQVLKIVRSMISRQCILMKYNPNPTPQKLRPHTHSIVDPKLIFSIRFTKPP